MDRDLQVHFYDKAVPLKAGVLRYPLPGPSVLKKKGILGKTGDYFSREAKPRLTLLLRVASEKLKKETDTLGKSYREEKFFITWDEDATDLIFSFLKDEAEGMCRHTRAELSAEKPNPAHIKGICTRQECSLLKVDELLMSYLKAPLTPPERHARYVKFLDRFPVDKETVLYDPDLFSKEGKLVTGGISKKTVRHIGHSNGVQLYTFPIMLNAESKLEAVKNVLRPLALTGMRNSTNRSFILKYVAHDDKDTITEWWRTISANLNGLGNEERGQEIKKTISDDPAVSASGKKLDPIDTKFAKDAPNVTIVKRYADKRYKNDLGKFEEVVWAEMVSDSSLDALFDQMVQTEDSFNPNENFDRFIFGDSGGASSVQQLKVFVEPLNNWDKVNDKFGNDRQTILVQAVTESHVNLGEWVSDAITKKLPFLNTIGKMLQDYGVFDSPNLDGVNEKENKLKRFFNMEKSYFVENDADGKAKSFTVVWSSVGDQGFQNSASKSGAYGASIDQLCIKVEKLSAWKPKIKIDDKSYSIEAISADQSLMKNQPKVNIDNMTRDFATIKKFLPSTSYKGETLISFQDKLFIKPAEARDFANSVIKELTEAEKEVPNNINNNVYAIWDAETLLGKYERVVMKLAANYDEGARLSALRLINYLLKGDISREIMVFSQVPQVPVEIIKAVTKILVGTRNVVVLEAGFEILTRMMKVGPYVKAEFAAKSAVVNKATEAFMSLIDALYKEHKGSLYAFEMLKMAMRQLDTVLSDESSCIATVNLDSVQLIGSIIAVADKHAKPSQHEVLNQLKIEYKKLEEKWFNGYSVINMRKRDKALSDIESKLSELNTATKENSAAKRQEIESIKVPYVTQSKQGDAISRNWRQATFEVSTKGFSIGETRKKLLNFQDFKKLTGMEVPEVYFQKYYVDTTVSPAAVADSGIQPEMLYENADEIISCVNSALEELSKKNESNMKDKVIRMIREISIPIPKLEHFPETRVTVKITANAEKLYGKDLVSRRSYLGEQWGKGFVDGIAKGFNEHKHAQLIPVHKPSVEKAVRVFSSDPLSIPV